MHSGHSRAFLTFRFVHVIPYIDILIFPLWFLYFLLWEPDGEPYAIMIE
jgi:hypothetical protein